MPDFAEAAGERIRVLRELHGLSRRDLANAMGVKDIKTIRNWEKGLHLPNSWPRWETLARTLRTTPEYLVRGDGDDSPWDAKATTGTGTSRDMPTIAQAMLHGFRQWSRKK